MTNREKMTEVILKTFPSFTSKEKLDFVVDSLFCLIEDRDIICNEACADCHIKTYAGAEYGADRED